MLDHDKPKSYFYSQTIPIILSKKIIQITPLDLNTKPEYVGNLIPFLEALHKL